MIEWFNLPHPDILATCFGWIAVDLYYKIKKIVIALNEED